MTQVNELELHKLKKKLDELDDLIDLHVVQGIRTPEEIRSDYQETKEAYNRLIEIQIEELNESFMDQISKESHDPN